MNKLWISYKDKGIIKRKRVERIGAIHKMYGYHFFKHDSPFRFGICFANVETGSRISKDLYSWKEARLLLKEQGKENIDKSIESLKEILISGGLKYPLNNIGNKKQ